LFQWCRSFIGYSESSILYLQTDPHGGIVQAMTPTVFFNHVYYAVCLIVAIVATLPTDWSSLVPPQIKPYVVGGVLAAAWLKAHWNLFTNPDGTDAPPPVAK